MSNKDQTCQDCTYFYQHYIREDDFERTTYIEVGSGHCTRPRLKTRKQDACICQYFLLRNPEQSKQR